MVPEDMVVGAESARPTSTCAHQDHDERRFRETQATIWSTI
jgi:hypothetical protein